MKPLLEAVNLSKRYGDRLVVDAADVSVASGEFVVVLGASGSGKTTLFRCLTRLVEPESGRILLDGQSLTDLRGPALARARRSIGVVFQQFNLVRRFSALDNVLAGRLADIPLWRVMVRRFKATDVAIATDALVAVGLAAHLHQRADTLSGGQQQRVAIARTLAQDCRVLLADEPVASLDPETAIAILSLLRDLARTRGLGILCTLHQPHLAERFADRVIIMDQGKLRAHSTPRATITAAHSR